MVKRGFFCQKWKINTNARTNSHEMIQNVTVLKKVE
jgi:hypothetical protein